MPIVGYFETGRVFVDLAVSDRTSWAMVAALLLDRLDFGRLPALRTDNGLPLRLRTMSASVC
jgi:hypothetical protein